MSNNHEQELKSPNGQSNHIDLEKNYSVDGWNSSIPPPDSSANLHHKVQVGRKHNLTSDVWDHMTRVILMEMLMQIAATAKQHLKLLAPMLL